MNKTILFVMALALTISLVSAQPAGFGSCPMGGMMYGSYGYGAMIVSWLFGLLVLVALVLLIIWLVKQINKNK
jgi:uncharacterized membrane protein